MTIFFIQVRGPQTKTSDGVERWHTVHEAKSMEAAQRHYDGWARSHRHDHDLRLFKDKELLTSCGRTVSSDVPKAD